MQIQVTRTVVLWVLVVDVVLAGRLRVAASAVAYVETVLLAGIVIAKLLGVSGMILVWASNIVIVLGLLSAAAKTARFYAMRHVPRVEWGSSLVSGRWERRERVSVRGDLYGSRQSTWIKTESFTTLFGSVALAISYLLFREALHQGPASLSQFAYFVASFSLVAEAFILGGVAVRRYLANEE
jgi:hypothetical protein